MDEAEPVQVHEGRGHHRRVQPRRVLTDAVDRAQQRCKLAASGGLEHQVAVTRSVQLRHELVRARREGAALAARQGASSAASTLCPGDPLHTAAPAGAEGSGAAAGALERIEPPPLAVCLAEAAAVHLHQQHARGHALVQEPAHLQRGPRRRRRRRSSQVEG